MALLPRLCVVLGGWRRCFSDHRTYRRAQEHAIALLVCLGRRTISRSICERQVTRSVNPFSALSRPYPTERLTD